MQGSIRQRRGKWSYIIYLGMVDGKKKYKEKGGFDKKPEAQSALRKALEELEGTGGIFEPTTISFSDYLDYFIENYVEVNLRENSQRARQHIIKNHLRPTFGNYKLKQITSQALQSFMTKKSKEYSKNYVSMIHATVSTAFKMAEEWDFIRNNPMAKVKVPKRDDREMDKKVKTLSHKDIQEISKIVKDTHHHISFMIALHTGMRAGEVAALQWSDFDEINKTITINKRLDFRASTKDWEFLPVKTSSSNRTIVIGRELIAALKAHRIVQSEKKLSYGDHYAKNDFICTKDNGDPVTTKTISRMSTMIKRYDIDFNFHMLRHTHATMLLEAGVNPKVVQERLGHSSVSITLDTYSHITTEFQRSAVSEFEKYLRKNKVSNLK